MKIPAVFLDRDGTINDDPGYLNSPEDLTILPRAAAGLKLLNEAGYPLFVVTNQSGIGRGYFTHKDLTAVNRKLVEELAGEGVSFTEIVWCPHHPEEHCSCRKPSPGMIFDLTRRHGLDLSRSYFIGDKISDILAGKRAGCGTVLIASPEKKKRLAGRDDWSDPDYTAPDLYQAARWIVKAK